LDCDFLEESFELFLAIYMLSRQDNLDRSSGEINVFCFTAHLIPLVVVSTRHRAFPASAGTIGRSWRFSFN
jgi:hypothetical protein